MAPPVATAVAAVATAPHRCRRRAPGPPAACRPRRPAAPEPLGNDSMDESIVIYTNRG